MFSCNQQQESAEVEQISRQFITPLGVAKEYPEASEAQLKNYEKALFDYNENPNDPDNIIWLGRRLAYMGKYDEAIETYTAGIQKIPDNPKFYRHRGHRYISTRQYKKAIADFERAVELIEGTENEIEPDGIPNARNTPVSSLHGNVYYHLGLAYYLVHDYEKAFEAYTLCRESGNNPDNIVSSTHWLYMISRRLGNEEQANEMLLPVEENMDIIENHDYYKLCLFYKGLLPADSLSVNDDSPSSDALKYGLANWQFYNLEKESAEEEFIAITTGNSWTSFGYIAAESDIIQYYKRVEE